MKNKVGFWPVMLLTVSMAVPAVAQQRDVGGGGGHASVEQLLLGIERAHSLLYEQLLAEPNTSMDRLEQEFSNRVVSEIAGGGYTGAASTPNLERLSPRLVSILKRTHALQRQVYEIYLDASITDKAGAIDAAVDRYLAEPEVALSPVPKSMEILDEEHGSIFFRDAFPRTAGVYWALRWVQLGGSEPLMFYRTAADQQAGVEATIARFREMLENPPETSPSHMPMAPTIAPELVTRHVRAAAIFDNFNMMHDALADILVSPDVDKRPAVDAVIDLFVDPESFKTTEIEWIRMSLRHGIYAQGGPAIGRLDRPERNAGHHHGAGHSPVIMPGG